MRLPLTTFVATQQAVAEREAKRWTQDTELAAINAEVTHALFRAFLGANSKKGASLPDPLRIPRPYEDNTAPKVSGPDVALLLGGGGA